MKLLILAGGSGTRLWPLSRANQPKQVKPLGLPVALDPRLDWARRNPFGGASLSAGRAAGNSVTLLQQTWRRLRRQYRASDIFVSTTRVNVPKVQIQLPELKQANLIVEPVARNTGPAIALAARILSKLYPSEAVATVSSDHYIASEDKYLKVLRAGEKLLTARPGSLILLGIKPTYPETGYGYIKLGKAIKTAGPAAYRVSQFTEKPSLARARKYLANGSYWWNSGLFIFQPAAFLKLMSQVAPSLARAAFKLKPVQVKAGSWQVSEKGFNALPAISIDYAVVEKSVSSLVMPAFFGWADVGHWQTIYSILAKRSNANVALGNYVEVNSSGNLVYSLSKRLVATVGLQDTVIIDTPGALLVCPRARAQEVRLLVEELKKRREPHKYL